MSSGIQTINDAEGIHRCNLFAELIISVSVEVKWSLKCKGLSVICVFYYFTMYALPSIRKCIEFLKNECNLLSTSVLIWDLGHQMHVILGNFRNLDIVVIHHKYITVRMLCYKLDMESELSQYTTDSAAHSPALSDTPTNVLLDQA